MQCYISCIYLQNVRTNAIINYKINLKIGATFFGDIQCYIQDEKGFSGRIEFER